MHYEVCFLILKRYFNISILCYLIDYALIFICFIFIIKQNTEVSFYYAQVLNSDNKIFTKQTTTQPHAYF